MTKRVLRFGRNNTSQDEIILPVPFVAQFGKNFTNDYNKLIRGSDLLELALQTVSDVQQQIGGRFVCLECEDKAVLVSFYESNGFTRIYDRVLDDSERYGNIDHLVQMIRYMR